MATDADMRRFNAAINCVREAGLDPSAPNASSLCRKICRLLKEHEDPDPRLSPSYRFSKAELDNMAVFNPFLQRAMDIKYNPQK